jgi:hypothetical protein
MGRMVFKFLVAVYVSEAVYTDNGVKCYDDRVLKELGRACSR